MGLKYNMSFEELIKDAMRQELDALVAGEPMHKRIRQTCWLAAEWAYDQRIDRAVVKERAIAANNAAERKSKKAS